MEIYRNSPDATAFLAVPQSVIVSNPTVSVVALDSLFPIYEFETVVAISTTERTGFEVTLPWELVQHDRDFFIDWRVTYSSGGVEQEFYDRQFIQIVTQILPLDEIARISGYTDMFDILDIERKVRYTIQTYTGQNFGKFRTRLSLDGTGESKLRLPYPLLAIYNSNFQTDYYYIYADGWFLGPRPYSAGGMVPARTEDQINSDFRAAPIRAPFRNRFNFHNDVLYTIDGIWGYHDVPADIRQAARILVDDYSCDESLWRDRYIESVRSGNWRFETARQAFAGTGNVLVDRILEKYRRMTMVVI